MNEGRPQYPPPNLWPVFLFLAAVAIIGVGSLVKELMT